MEYQSENVKQVQKESMKDWMAVCFYLGQQEFGIPIHQVKEIIVPRKITKVIYTPDIIEGVLNLRGIIVMVLNLKKIFDIPDNPNVEKNVVILDNDGKNSGVLVDKIESVERIERSKIEFFEEEKDQKKKLCEGVVQYDNHSLTLLNIANLLDLPEIHQFCGVTDAEG